MNTKKQINIFIVDDNKIFSLALKASIENAFGKLNYKTYSFETGEKCLERFSELVPELVILDFFLSSASPHAANGLQILDRIKKITKETSVIMLTSNSEIDTALKSFHHGVSDYIVKTESQFKKINQSIANIFAKKEKKDAEIIVANKELAFQNKENQKRVDELNRINIQKDAAERSKLVVEEKHKSITDSINYAKRIQLAKLPRKEEIYAALPQSFVLFKPKDIVSGDFYFFHQTVSRIIIVAADCTGHGVPGAFMSMIGSEKLDDAVAHNSDTSEILKHLNKGIKSSLHQSDNKDSTKDGMDIAICSIDIENGTVKYAGANRPFWLIRKGSEEIEEIKGTKKAIGGFTEDSQHFESHELQLKAGDTFYISTDGYVDQFGGEHGKKLMTKKFKEILVSIQDKPMEQQNIHLDNFIQNWMKGVEQVDDILVIGIRL